MYVICVCVSAYELVVVYNVKKECVCVSAHEPMVGCNMNM